eukprot:ANDGO_00023.mRNA.1 hypothetical protein
MAVVDSTKESAALQKSMSKFMGKLTSSADQDFFNTFQEIVARIVKYPNVKRIPYFAEICRVSTERMLKREPRPLECNAICGFLEMLFDTRSLLLGELFNHEYAPWLLNIVLCGILSFSATAPASQSPAVSSPAVVSSPLSSSSRTSSGVFPRTPTGGNAASSSDTLLRRLMNMLRYYTDNADSAWHARYMVPALVLAICNSMHTSVRSELQAMLNKMDLSLQIPAMAASLEVASAEEKRLVLRYFRVLFEKHVDNPNSNAVSVILNFTSLFAFLAKSVNVVWAEVVTFLVSYIRPEMITEKNAVMQLSHFLMDLVKKLRSDAAVLANSTLVMNGSDENAAAALSRVLSYLAMVCQVHQTAFCEELNLLIETEDILSTVVLYEILCSETAIAQRVIEKTFPSLLKRLMACSVSLVPLQSELQQIMRTCQMLFAPLFYSTHIKLLQCSSRTLPQFDESVRCVEFYGKWSQVYRVFPCDLIEAALRMSDSDGTDRFFELFVQHLFVDDVASQLDNSKDFDEYVVEAIAVMSAYLKDKMLKKEEIPVKKRKPLCTTLRRLYELGRPKHRPQWIPIVASLSVKDDALQGYTEDLRDSSYLLVAAAAPIMARDYVEPFMSYAFERLDKPHLAAASASILCLCGFYFPAKVREYILSQMYSADQKTRLVALERLQILWTYRFKMMETYLRACREGPSKADADEDSIVLAPLPEDTLLQFAYPVTQLGVMRESDSKVLSSVLLQKFDYVPASAFVKGNVSLERIVQLGSTPASPGGAASPGSPAGSTSATSSGDQNLLAAAVEPEEEVKLAPSANSARGTGSASSGLPGLPALRSASFLRVVTKMKSSGQKLHARAVDRRAIASLEPRTQIPQIFCVLTYAVFDLLEDESVAVSIAAHAYLSAGLAEDPSLLLSHVFNKLADIDNVPGDQVLGLLHRLHSGLLRLTTVPPNCAYAVCNILVSLMNHISSNRSMLELLAPSVFSLLGDITASVDGLPVSQMIEQSQKFVLTGALSVADNSVGANATTATPAGDSFTQIATAERIFFAHRALRSTMSGIADADVASAFDRSVSTTFSTVGACLEDICVMWMMYCRRLIVSLPAEFVNIGPYVESMASFLQPDTASVVSLRLAIAFTSDVIAKYPNAVTELELFKVMVPAFVRLYEHFVVDAIISSSIRWLFSACVSAFGEDVFFGQAISALSDTFFTPRETDGLLNLELSPKTLYDLFVALPVGPADAALPLPLAGVDMLDVKSVLVYQTSLLSAQYSLDLFINFLCRYISASLDESSLTGNKRSRLQISSVLRTLVPYALRTYGHIQSDVIGAVIQQCISGTAVELATCENLCKLCFALATEFVDVFSQIAPSVQLLLDQYITIAATRDAQDVACLTDFLLKGLPNVSDPAVLQGIASAISGSLVRLLANSNSSTAAFAWNCFPQLLSSIGQAMKQKTVLCDPFASAAGDALIFTLLLSQIPVKVRRELWMLTAFSLRGAKSSIFSRSETLARVFPLQSPAEVRQSFLQVLIPVALRLGEMGCVSEAVSFQQWSMFCMLAAYPLAQRDPIWSSILPESLCLLKCVLIFCPQCVREYATQIFSSVRNILYDLQTNPSLKVLFPAFLEFLEACIYSRSHLFLVLQPFISQILANDATGIPVRTDKVKDTLDRIRFLLRSWSSKTDWNVRLSDEYRILVSSS